MPWLKSDARAVLLEHLHEGVLTLDEAAMSTEDAWEYYSQLEEFKLVPWAQFQ